MISKAQLAVAALLALTLPAWAADLVLVQDGQPRAVVVCGPPASPAAQTAAAELVKYLAKMSGATLPVLKPDQPLPAGQTVIRLRSGSAQAERPEGTPELAPEELRLEAQPGELVLSGGDCGPTGVPLQGTLWAVYELLERLGVRWLWPGELGEVVPHRTTVTVPEDLSYRFVPPIIQRKIRAIGWNERVQSGLDKLGFTREQFEANFATGADWWQHQRNGTQGNFSYGHAYADYWSRFGQTHPEWFALQPNGSRDQGTRSPDRARLCVSNPELAKQVAADAIARLRADPSLYCTSISPNDGGPQAFCTCPNCEAWDAKDGEVIEMNIGGDNRHVSLTDRYVKFYNAVAAIVAQELPGRYLGAYAYSAYRLPPLQVTLAPNVFVGYVGLTYLNDASRATDLASWDGWAKAAPGGLFLRPNLFMSGMGYPVIYVHRLGADLKHCAATGMKVADFDTCFQHWALNGLDYYVTARLIWNPGLTVDEIVDDYCRTGFGPAAEPVKAYFAALEKLTDDLAATSQYRGYRPDSALLGRQFSDEFLARAYGYLDEGLRLAGDDATVKARLAFLRVGLDYARLNRDYFLADEALRGDLTGRTAAEREALKAALRNARAAKLEYLKQLGVTWALNSAYMLFYGL